MEEGTSRLYSGVGVGVNREMGKLSPKIEQMLTSIVLNAAK